MEKEKLEKAYPLFTIIWQLDNAEDEYSKIVGNEKNKDKLNKLAIKKIDKFVNKDFWNRVLTPIKTKDSEISSTNV